MTLVESRRSIESDSKLVIHADSRSMRDSKCPATGRTLDAALVSEDAERLLDGPRADIEERSHLANGLNTHLSRTGVSDLSFEEME